MMEAAKHAESQERHQDARLMKPREVAEFLQISERKVYGLVRAGELPAKRYGGRWRFERAAVLAAGDRDKETSHG